MARQEGVEPPTAWFVARNSIQLSYQREGAYYVVHVEMRQLSLMHSYNPT